MSLQPLDRARTPAHDRQSRSRPATAADPPLPTPRGPMSGFLVEHLRRAPHALPPPPAGVDDPLDGEDSALALYLCYELHYRGFDHVDDKWEWEPSLLAVRARIEQDFTDRVAQVTTAVPSAVTDVANALHQLLADGAGPSLSTYVAESASRDQLLELLVHRSAYQLKEADPHTWGIPRLRGQAKAAMVEIQADEYGGGVEQDMHAELFARCLREVGLDARYGAYLDRIPGPTLATVNLVSLFGLHRRWRGALVGHLAAFEMTSVEPMGRYSLALRRHGFGPWARLFFDAHVVADAHHQTVAAHQLAAGLVREEPHLVGDVLYGASALMAVEERFTQAVLDAWSDGRTSLLAPL